MAINIQDYSMPSVQDYLSEEERKKRAQEAADNATPVKQTIETNPVTGEQNMTISGSMKDLSPSNPLTPTVTGPSIPEQVQQPMVQQPQVQQPQVQQPTMAPAAPVVPEQAPVQQAPVQQAPAQQAVQPVSPVQAQQPELPQPGPSVQVAGPMTTPPQPYTGQGVQMNQPVTQQAMANVTPSLSQISQDPMKLASYYGNENNPEPDRKIAGELYASHLQRNMQQQDANQLIQRAVAGDPKAVSEMTRDLMKNRSEGSYVKAILFQRLGLTDLAKEEQQKLGSGSTITQTIDKDGKLYTVEVGGQGDIVRGWNDQGNRIDDKTLVSLRQPATKAYQMASAHGTPVINAKGEMGQMMYDPVLRKTYVQVGNEQLPTTGWTTMAQNVQNVYGAAGAQAQGKAAGEGFTPQVLPSYPGGPTPAGTTPTNVSLPGVNAQPGTPEFEKQRQLAIQRSEGDIAGLHREISSIPNTPQNQGRIATLNTELTRAQTQRQQLGGAIQGLPGTAGAGVPGASVAQQKANLAVEEARQKEGIQVAGARSQSFNKILDEEVRPQAQAGDTVVNTRKQQFQIFDRPGIDSSKLFGLYSAAQENPSDQKLAIIRDILGGQFKPEAEVSQRLAQLDLTPQEKSALAEYNIANQRINAATLKQNSGPGSISDTEQRANREANVDPTRIPALGAYNAMAQSQFNGDLARYKGDWAQNSTATNALQLDKEWRKEQQKLINLYGDIAKKRSEFIASAGGTPGAVKEGYRRFPIPEYDPQTESWKKTKPLTAYER